MADPFTLAAVGAVLASEGVKFLYQQAGELLRWLRERKEAGEGEAGEAPVLARPPENVFTDASPGAVPDFAIADAAQERLIALQSTVTPYVQGYADLAEASQDALGAIGDLRRLLEGIYDTALTMRGEDRPAGTVVTGRVAAREVLGDVIGVDIEDLRGVARVHGEVDVGTIEKGGTATGTHIGRIERNRESDA
jgi:hypothetical protein